MVPKIFEHNISIVTTMPQNEAQMKLLNGRKVKIGPNNTIKVKT